MYGKKEKLANIFYHIGANKMTAALRRLVINDVRIIAYHRICDTDAYNDKELVSANCEQFELQVKHIKENYNAITFAQLIDSIDSGKKLPRNSIIITFDDGFADNYHNAFKILKRHQVPATIFISTGYIDQADTFWFNWLSRVVKLNVGKKFTIDDVNYVIEENQEKQEELLVTLLALNKNRANKDRLALLESLKKQLDFNDECDELAAPMTWDEVREMSKGGVEFGSHTVSHPILSQLTDEELHVEIVESKQKLEKELGIPIQTISYPEGMEYAYNQKVIDKVVEAGYEMGASYIPGVNKLASLETFQLKRMHIERYVSHHLFCSMLALPEIFA